MNNGTEQPKGKWVVQNVTEVNHTNPRQGNPNHGNGRRDKQMNAIITTTSTVLRLAWGMALAAWMAALAAPCGAAEDQTIIPGSGTYQVMELVLENAKHGSGSSRGGLALGQNTVLRAAFRDGKIRLPSRLSVRDIISTLTVENGSISGEAIIQGEPRIMSELRCKIVATTIDGKITGTWEKADQSAKGAISGWLKSEADLMKTNAFTTKADWPQWNGPTTSMAATPCNLKLVTDFPTEARLMWRSEELVPNGNGNAFNYPGLTFCDRTMGGGASLIVVDGKVIVNYYQPAGDAFLPNTVYVNGVKPEEYKPGPAEVFLAYQAKKLGIEIPPFTREKWLLKADDVVVCMDAVTGKTLWKNIFALKSMNQPQHKGGVVNNTPCAGDGRVFAMGPGGTLHGIVIATGKVLWERTGMSAEKVMPWSGARNMCTSPIYADGTLIMPDHGSTLTGLDPATGKDLWKLSGKGYRFQVPTKWTTTGQELVLSVYVGKMTKTEVAFKACCIQAKTGTILWEIDLPPGLTMGGVIVHGDSMYAVSCSAARGGGDDEGDAAKDKEKEKAGGGFCTAYHLSLSKAEQIWQTPVPDANVHPTAACDGKVVVVKGGHKASYLLDAATGKLLAELADDTGGNECHAAIMGNRVFLSKDGSHGHSDMKIVGTTPETFTKALSEWSQPHPQTTSYHNKFMTWPMVEGRIFMRGYDGVYCYDLRKDK